MIHNKAYIKSAAKPINKNSHPPTPNGPNISKKITQYKTAPSSWIRAASAKPSPISKTIPSPFKRKISSIKNKSSKETNNSNIPSKYIKNKTKKDKHAIPSISPYTAKPQKEIFKEYIQSTPKIILKI
jgi:hypothetical protein